VKVTVLKKKRYCGMQRGGVRNQGTEGNGSVFLVSKQEHKRKVREKG